MNIGTELLEKVLGFDRDTIESANFNIETKILRYYLVSLGYDFPQHISKEDLMILCKKNEISYNVLINIFENTGTLEEIEIEMSKLHEDKYKYEAHILDNSLIDLSSLSLNEIEEELESFINCFKNIKFKNNSLSLISKIYYKDHSGNILYDINGNEAFYRKDKIFKIPKINIYRNENELVLDLLLNKLFHNVIK